MSGSEEPGGSPQKYGQYAIVETIGKGSMGTVYRAVGKSGQEVALKLMSPALSNDEDGSLAERFRREAQTAIALDHPNVTKVYEFGEENGQLFMAMEMLRGLDLKQLIDTKAAGSLGERLSIMTQASAGMAFVHARGLVHRDLKPGNIHITPTGHVRILDFGLVRLTDSEMTRTGMMMGSPAYMDPEQMKGQKADARSDVFSLGAVFYELLSGQRAFLGKGLTQIMMNVLMQQPPPLTSVAPETPLPVVRIVERCLKKEPAQRYQTAGELHAALDVALGAYGNPSS